VTDPLPVFKALGDDTRFAIYQELGNSPAPLSATELAERLALHPNTVRPHLDRMREAGLVEVEPIHRGTVGRPQLRYSLAPGAPGLGFDPPAHTLLAGLLAALAEQLGGDGLDAANLGRRWGTEASGRRQSGWSRSSAPRPAATAAGSGSTSSTAPSGSWPRPTPSWSATSTGASSTAWSARAGGPVSRREWWRTSVRWSIVTRAM
jgi:DNA-binding transcriptional ArsR family regulator